MGKKNVPIKFRESNCRFIPNSTIHNPQPERSHVSGPHPVLIARKTEKTEKLTSRGRIPLTAFGNRWRGQGEEGLGVDRRGRRESPGGANGSTAPPAF